MFHGQDRLRDIFLDKFVLLWILVIVTMYVTLKTKPFFIIFWACVFVIMWLYRSLQGEVNRCKQLEKNLLQIGDAERQRIGRDLHDGLGQYFTAIQMTSMAIRRDYSKHGLEQEVKKVDDMVQFIAECMQSVREISRGLFLIHQEKYELRLALEEIASNAKRMYSISCELDYSTEFNMNHLETVTHLYRIVQEAIHNAVRHGQADNIVIRVKKDECSFTLYISDNGIGISNHFKNGLGMFTMKYRTELLGGKLTITPNTPNGTTICCAFKIFYYTSIIA